MKKICIACGKEYEARRKDQKYCKGPHFAICTICGKQIEYYTSPAEPPSTCSKECKQKRRVQLTREKYGVDNISQLPQVRAKKQVSNRSEAAQSKSRETCMKKYGTPFACQSSEIRDKISNSLRSPEVRKKTADTFMAKYGVDHVFKDKSYREANGCNDVMNTHPQAYDKFKQTLKMRYGVDKLADIPGVKAKSKCHRESTMIERYGQAQLFNTDTFKQDMLSRYGVENIGLSSYARKQAGLAKGKFFASDGTPVESSYEQIVYDFCLRNNLEFQYQSYKIDYEYNSKKHTTLIDFVIEGIPVECKGGHLMSGLFDDRVDVPTRKKLQVYAENGVIVVTDSDGSHQFGPPNSEYSNGLLYKNRCKNPLIGIDIQLFTLHPQFPFRYDRPTCFYKVKVNGSKCCYDAFYDESARWRMIKNRILYAGGFITSSNVVRGFNESRFCKQPSWFPKSLAIRLLNKYATSNTIYDLAAGWGTRLQACKELNLTYIGCDYNKELVDWLNSRIGFVTYSNGKEFKCNDKCSIFICPPYWNPKTNKFFEDYNFKGFIESAQGLTQCDWLRIAMQNAPNFIEAIMVCKIVDDGWDKFIVETIEHSCYSHKTYEYVLRVLPTDELPN